MSSGALSIPDAGDDDLLAEAVEILKTRAPAPARKYLPGPDLDKMPSGYDPEIWQLALDFTQAAKHYDVELATGKPLVYAYLFRTINDAPKIRSRDDWTGLIRMMIKEFFENDIEIDHEEYAVEQFTMMSYFKDCARWALRNRADARGEIKSVERHPAPVDEEVQKRRDRCDSGPRWFVKLIHADGVRYLAGYREAVGRARPHAGEVEFFGSEEDLRQEYVSPEADTPRRTVRRMAERPSLDLDMNDKEAVQKFLAEKHAELDELNERYGYNRDGAE
jgi:hypothetical protein